VPEPQSATTDRTHRVPRHRERPLLPTDSFGGWHPFCPRIRKRVSGVRPWPHRDALTSSRLWLLILPLLGKGST